MSDDDVSTTQRICFECVGEEYLSNEISQTGLPGTCSYCGSTQATWSIEALASRIDSVFDEHYDLTSNEPTALEQSMLSDRESSYEWERLGVPVIEAIQDAAELSEEAARDVQSFLDEKHSSYRDSDYGEETPFSSDTHYAERKPNDAEWQREWYAFEKSLRSEARFFSRIASSHLSAVFSRIDQLKTSSGRALILDAGPKFVLDHLFRARVFQSEDALKEAMCRPDLHLGSPPAGIASAGRMNARGISVFYGATDASVAIAEVRPPVGSWVAVARLNITRPLRLLDLTALESVHDGGSIFDPSVGRRLGRVAFLRSLGQRMTRAVMPGDESLDYLATQAIADFLATENDPLLDGIMFRSVQARVGNNVVLFHKAARVEVMEIPNGAEIEASTGFHNEDGWEDDYSVMEWVPKPSDAVASGGTRRPFLPLRGYRVVEEDERQYALQVVPESVVVNEVEWVEYQCTAFDVRRSRHEKHDW